jgi:hypothetical protein
MAILNINRMFKTACLATLLIVNCPSRADDNLAADSARLPTPILTGDQAVKLAEDYVTKVKYRD